jgi:hypothetical protein
MIRAKLGRHPGEARMMVASRPHHGKAMMWASPTRHPGSARMINNCKLSTFLFNYSFLGKVFNKNIFITL